MDKKDLKKFLAGLGIASLISAGGMTLTGCTTSGSGCSANKDDSSNVQKEVEKPAGSG